MSKHTAVQPGWAETMRRSNSIARHISVPLYIDRAAAAERVTRSSQQGERHGGVLLFLRLSLAPSPVSDALVATPALYFISYLLSNCFTAAGLDSFL